MFGRSLRQQVIRSLAQALPPQVCGELPGSTPNCDGDDRGHALVCEALIRLQESGVILNWSVQEVSRASVEVHVQPTFSHWEVMRFDLASLHDLASVADVMDS